MKAPTREEILDKLYQLQSVENGRSQEETASWVLSLLEAEREACAELADLVWKERPAKDDMGLTFRGLASAIRARGNVHGS